ncbi:hypothetical protein ACFQZ4_45820 [Catellatospora coxensis]|uniref:Dienelactone hydrolase family protein n=1 Tax=Catellatospora coxensis TaxID=310354 RepID=A0A8J3KNC9_9ACTN|nr:hypothetical protein [Catellatospora coxensis]GIG05708.1 hypothetical protein Cco03nite_24080 [Catellatospora coxensis]
MIELSRDAAAMVGDHAQVCIVPDANHLFSEPGALQQVAELAIGWFYLHMAPAAAAQLPQERSAAAGGRKACPGTT